jgi:hypothetical protein
MATRACGDQPVPSACNTTPSRSWPLLPRRRGPALVRTEHGPTATSVACPGSAGQLWVARRCLLAIAEAKNSAAKTRPVTT